MTPRPSAHPGLHRCRRRPCTGRGRAGRAAAGLALLVASLALLAGCSPTEGDSTLFEPLATTFTEFESPAYFPVGNEPWFMDVTTQGGLLRVAVVNRVGTPPLDPAGDPTPGTVMVLQGDGGGSFTVAQTISAGEFPTQAFWADMDGVNEPDLVIVSNLSRTIAVHLGTGTGWSPTPDYTFTLSYSAAQVSIVDLEGDGDDDVVMTDPRGRLIVALVNTIALPGTLTRVDSTVEQGLGKFAWGLFNGDTNVDLALIRVTDNSVYFYQWNGTAFVSGPGSTTTVTSTIADIAAGDLEGDGDTDLAVLSDRGNNVESRVTRLNNNSGTGVFSGFGYSNLLERAHRLVPLGDVITTSPGPEIAVMHTNQRNISVLQASGSGFAVTELGTSRNPVDAVSGDVAGGVGGDGNPDIITVEEEKRALGIFRGDGSGGFERRVVAFRSILRSPHAVDLDSTGTDDLIVLQPYEDRLVILLHTP